MTGRYLNTDLLILSNHDITTLSADFEGQCDLVYTGEWGDQWLISVEAAGSGIVGDSESCPERDIRALLSTLNTIRQEHTTLFGGATIHVDVGWESAADSPNQHAAIELSAAVLQEITSAGANLRFTVYPPDDDTTG